MLASFDFSYFLDFVVLEFPLLLNNLLSLRLPWSISVVFRMLVKLLSTSLVELLDAERADPEVEPELPDKIEVPSPSFSSNSSENLTLHLIYMVTPKKLLLA